MVKENFENIEVVKLIHRYRQLSDDEKKIFHKNAKTVWKKKFNADINYRRFIFWIKEG